MVTQVWPPSKQLPPAIVAPYTPQRGCPLFRTSSQTSHCSTPFDFLSTQDSQPAQLKPVQKAAKQRWQATILERLAAVQALMPRMHLASPERSAEEIRSMREEVDATEAWEIIGEARCCPRPFPADAGYSC